MATSRDQKSFCGESKVQNPVQFFIENEIQWNLEEKTMGIVAYKVILN